MTISDNTERGSIKLTCCSCRKKKRMKWKIYQQRNAEIQNKTYIWAEVFFFLTCDQAFVFFLSFGLDPVTTQSNHLLGNPWYTLMERLLANLTHLRFVFGFFLARKNGFESVWFSETYMRLETERHQSQKWSGTEIKKLKMVWGCITLQAVGFSCAKRERNHCEQPSAFPSSMGELVTPHVMHLMPKFICQ